MLTTSTMIDCISKDKGWHKPTVKKVIEAAVEYLNNAAVAGETVKIHGLGVFEPREYAPGNGYSVHLRKVITRPGRTRLVFRACKRLRDI